MPPAFESPYTGSLVAMFAAGAAIAEFNTLPELWAKGMNQSYWTDYAGHDCQPFKVYTRYYHDRIVIANIQATDPSMDREPAVRKGRMPLIIAACAVIRKHVIVESVVNPSIEVWLQYQGFTENKQGTRTYEKFFE